MNKRLRIGQIAVLGGFALGTLLFGVGTLFWVLLTLGAYLGVAQVEALRPLPASVVNDGVPGQEVLVEGTISPDNLVRVHDFVAYEVWRDEDNAGEQEPYEVVNPSLLIALEDGLVRVASGYELRNQQHRIREEGQEYQGFAAGDTVLAVGELVRGSEGLEFQAEFVYGGSRADYLQINRLLRNGSPVCAGLFGLLTLALAFLGVRRLRRQWSAAGAR